ncbi:hypothetical protein TNCV_927111, partial [Trichonephila clavipes]
SPQKRTSDSRTFAPEKSIGKERITSLKGWDGLEAASRVRDLDHWWQKTDLSLQTRAYMTGAYRRLLAGHSEVTFTLWWPPGRIHSRHTSPSGGRGAKSPPRHGEKRKGRKKEEKEEKRVGEREPALHGEKGFSPEIRVERR